MVLACVTHREDARPRAPFTLDERKRCSFVVTRETINRDLTSAQCEGVRESEREERKSQIASAEEGSEERDTHTERQCKFKGRRE